jgi:peptidoglycan/LPS O-acetylase OafA/YrhL
MKAPVLPTSAPDDGFDAFRAKGRFGSLDGLRAISVAAVIWHHSSSGIITASWAQHGHQGVTLFFAISGFLITTLLLREHDRRGTIDLRAFYMRRALRIFPLYYAVLLLYVVLVFVMERHTAVGRAFFDNLPYFATYTSNWFVALDGRTVFYFSWSLAAEEQFYLVWPPLLKAVRTRRRALAVAGSIVIALSLLDVLLPIAGTGLALLRFVHGVPLAIIVGVVAALLLHERKSFDACWSWLGGSRWHSVGWGIAALVCIVTPGINWFAGQAALALFVAACCIREDHVLSGPLSRPFMVYLGAISYGLYLLHMLCRNVVAKVASLSGVTLDGVSMFVLTFALAVVAAHFSFKHFESRFLRMKVRYERATVSTAMRVAPSA